MEKPDRKNFKAVINFARLLQKRAYTIKIIVYSNVKTLLNTKIFSYVNIFKMLHIHDMPNKNILIPYLHYIP